MIGNVFGSPRTTFAGAAALVVGLVGSQLLPALVTYLGAQPNLGWKVAGYALGMIPPAFMTDLQAKLAKIAAGGAILLALSLPAGALADSPAPLSVPAFGGAWATSSLGVVSVGPSASAIVNTFDPATGRLESGRYQLGAGYGVGVFSDRWYSVSLSGSILYDLKESTTPARAAVGLAFAHYLRAFYGYGGRIMFGVGVGQ